jgi:hypothetical protein
MKTIYFYYFLTYEHSFLVSRDFLELPAQLGLFSLVDATKLSQKKWYQVSGKLNCQHRLLHHCHHTRRKINNQN